VHHTRPPLPLQQSSGGKARKEASTPSQEEH